MSKITGLTESKLPGKPLNVFLDGRFAFSLQTETAARENLYVSQELSEADVARLTSADRFQRCLNATNHLLSFRPRSEAEIKSRLRRRGFEPVHIEAVLQKLKDQNYVDDAAFARFWAEDRETFNPRSRRFITRELKQKGIDEEIIRQIVATIDEDDSAYRSALKKSRHWVLNDYRQFSRKVAGYLQRRGFSYEVTSRVISRIWQERGNSPETDDTVPAEINDLNY